MEESETGSRVLDWPVKERRKSNKDHINPIEAALRCWWSALPKELVEGLGLDIERLLGTAAKRWVVYPPLILLPSGSFGVEFWAQAQRLEKQHIDALWRELLSRIGKKEGRGVLTHLAVNSGIPLNKSEDGGDKKNILRTPSGLIMLYGDFGLALSSEQSPSLKDIENAFWVSTKQNGITQVWAPRHTMFSRGNVKEKSRLLKFHSSVLEDRTADGHVLRRRTAVDLYAGIGYFTFSYIKMGIGRVFGWELNPWSVEGLRRGALANGWSMKVVSEDETWTDGGEKIVVFLEDNGNAVQRLKGLNQDILGSVSHVNGGLLPTSEASWKMSLEILERNGWLHLHENVGVNDVEHRQLEIEDNFRRWLKEKGDERQVKVEHVEFVKTFAPGVWHCVFDVYIHST